MNVDQFLAFDAKLDKLGEGIRHIQSELKTARDILTDVVNSFENLGCQGCGTVSIEVINKARKFLGIKKI